jgi:hypothetical protein
MMDFNSFLKIQESVKEIINKTLPGINQDAINTISINLTILVQKEIYDFSGCKVPFDTYKEIHAKWLSGIKQIELAEEYKLNLSTINKICNDKLIVRRR